MRSYHVRESNARRQMLNEHVGSVVDGGEMWAREAAMDGDDGLGVSTEGREQQLNIARFMNSAPVTVQRHCPGTRVHALFIALGLRHLCVVDGGNVAVGVITRKDVARAIAACSSDTI